MKGRNSKPNSKPSGRAGARTGAKIAARPQARVAKPGNHVAGVKRLGPAQAGRVQLREQGPKARWVIGIHSVEEALRVRAKSAHELWLREDHLSSQSLRDIAAIAERSRIPIKVKTAGQLDLLGSGHQGVAIGMTETPKLDWEALKGPGHKIVIVLDGIEDVHNLGSILRTAWLTGVVGVVIPEVRAVGLTPTVCKIASGGAEHVPVDANTNLPSILQDLKDAGFWIYGLSEKGASVPWQLQLPEKVAWVIGSEGSGIRIPTERACDELVRIPQVHTGSSYNAAIATAMALVETCRQFGHPT